MGKLIIERELIQRAAKHCSDEKTKKELDELLFRDFMETCDYNDIRDGIRKTTPLPFRAV